ncbi:MAG: AMP-binding protein [Methanobrevibacter sp.]|nr:AMP-binding protein [Methanobrevibacter sp.]
MEGENLSDINYVTKSDLSILNEINHTESVLKYGDVLEAFNDNLLKHPKNSLVTYNDNVYSYDEGAFIANEISNKLKSIGVEKEDNIAFLVERSELYIFTILGILSAGAVYVPLDDTLPDERLNFMINDVDAKVVIASDETYNRADDLTDDAVLLNISDILKGDIETLSSLPVTASPLACILYTSGTTGIPKGVKITRKSLVNFIEFYVKKSGIDYQDIFAMYASIGLM